MDIADQQKTLNELRIILERAFDYKAERYSPSELAAYFARRELLPTLIHQRMHHALKGRKGTGKTAILKYLSLPVQVYACDPDMKDFVGFYLTFGQDLPPLISFDPQTERDMAQLFGHWFNLYSSKAIVDSLASAITEGFQGISPREQEKFLAALWASFFKIQETPPSSFTQASLTLNNFQSELRTSLSDPFVDKSKLINDYPKSNQYKYKGKVTDAADFRGIFEILNETINFFNNKSFFILMDEFDGLSPAQQVVINSAIARSTGLCYAKLGILSEQGIKDRSTISGLILREDQLKLIDIEEFATYNQFEDFVRACVAARLKRIQKQVSGIPELQSLFSDPDRLFPSKRLSDQLKEYGIPVERRKQLEQLTFSDFRDESISGVQVNGEEVEGEDIDAWWTFLKHERQPTYCGIQLISLLASGLIRSAIEIVYAILKDAVSSHWDIVRQMGYIPYDVQDTAIRKEADHWLSIKLQSDILGKTWDGEGHLADVARRFIRSILNNFTDIFHTTSKEIALNRFSVKELRNPQADGIRALEQGELTGIFRRMPRSAVPANDAMAYSLHRLYSVQNNLPPYEIGCLRLSWSEFEKYSRPPLGATIKRQDTNVQIFFGIGFRQKWENDVRKVLPKLLPPRYQYSDGAGAHRGSILVIGTVENKIDAAQLCLFDVTTENENVCFEYGLALAKKKPIRHLLNREKATIKHPKELIPFLRGIVVEEYKFSDEAAAEGMQSLREAISKCAAWYAGRQRSRKKLCPIDTKCRFSPTPLETQVFLATPAGSLANRCLPDLQRLIRDELRLQWSEVRTRGERPYICNVCQLVGRAKYCIVDTTGCDPTNSGILGLAFGFGGKKILNIYESGHSGLITNYAGHLCEKYSNKDELLSIVREFLQS